MNTYIDDLIEAILPNVTALRHELHTYPETALKEKGTRDRLLRWFSGMNVSQSLSFNDPLIGTDLVANLLGDRGELIGLRADMDALPLEETTGVSYSSKHQGVMHACGHDGHMAILAGTIAVLAEIESSRRPSVRMIFQPGEEEVCAGAQLVSAGVCEGLDKVYALHGWPGFRHNCVAAKPGVVTAAAGTFCVTFRGDSCHGAVPQSGNNPLIPAADLVLKLTQLHREVSQKYDAVVSCCSVQGGGRSTNVIPGSSSVCGTVRFLEEQAGKYIEQEFHRAVSECENQYGVSGETDYQCRYYLPVVNDEGEFLRVSMTAERLFGKQQFFRMQKHSMVAEDFAFYLDRVPGCMFMLGMGEDHAGLHSQYFDFDDALLKTGIQMMVNLVIGQ